MVFGTNESLWSLSKCMHHICHSPNCIRPGWGQVQGGKLPASYSIIISPHIPQLEAGRLNGRPCQLVATESSHADGPRQLYIVQRWLQVVLHIRRERGCSAHLAWHALLAVVWRRFSVARFAMPGHGLWYLPNVCKQPAVMSVATFVTTHVRTLPPSALSQPKGKDMCWRPSIRGPPYRRTAKPSCTSRCGMACWH